MNLVEIIHSRKEESAAHKLELRWLQHQYSFLDWKK